MRDVLIHDYFGVSVGCVWQSLPTSPLPIGGRNSVLAFTRKHFVPVAEAVKASVRCRHGFEIKSPTLLPQLLKQLPGFRKSGIDLQCPPRGCGRCLPLALPCENGGPGVRNPRVARLGGLAAQ